MKLMGLASTVIVARLLVPADFGIFAVAMTLVSMVGVFTDLGADLALIRHLDPKPQHYNTAWTFNVLVHTTAALLVVLSAAVVVHVYGDPRYQTVLYVLALSMFLDGLTNPGIADFRRSQRFHKDFQYNVIIQFIGVVSTILSAWFFRSYWALLTGTLTRSVASLILSYGMHPCRPRFSLVARHEMFGFSFWNMWRSVAQFMAGRADRLVIGAYFGSTITGFYTVTGELAGMAVYEFLHPIGRALFPSLAASQREGPQAVARASIIFNSTATLALALGGGLSALAEPVMSLVYGQKFVEAAPMLTVFALVAAVSGFSQPVGQLMIVRGKSRDMALLSILQGGISVAIISALAVAGAPIMTIVMVKWALEILALLRLFYLLRFIQGLTWKTMVVSWIRPAIACLIMYGVLWYFRRNVPLPAGLAVLVGVPMGAMVYCSILLLLWHLMLKPPGIEDKLLGLFKRKFNIGVAE
jgi:O-antigen/teichoic acid export membrane protein